MSIARYPNLSSLETKAGRLQRACLELLREHERDGALPTNGRFLFYELEQKGVIPKYYLYTKDDQRKNPKHVEGTKSPASLLKTSPTR